MAKNHRQEGAGRREFTVSKKSADLMTRYTADEFLQLGTNVRMCLNVNSLGYKDLDQIREVVKEHIPEALDGLSNQNRLTWFPIEGGVNDDNSYEARFGPVIEKYNQLAVKDEARVVNYGSVEVCVDFSKISDIDPEALKSGGYGFFVVSDFERSNEILSARIRLGKGQSFNISQFKDAAVRPIMTLKENVVTLFRRRAVIVIYYIRNKVEKEPGVWFPNMTIISIPLHMHTRGKSIEFVHGEINKDTQVEADPAGRILRALFGVSSRFIDIDNTTVKAILKIFGITNNAKVNEYLDIVDGIREKAAEIAESRKQNKNKGKGKNKRNSRPAPENTKPVKTENESIEEESDESNNSTAEDDDWDDDDSNQTSDESETGEEADYEEADGEEGVETSDETEQADSEESDDKNSEAQ